MEENQNGAEKASLSQKLETIKEQLMQLKTKSSDIISEEVEVSDTIKKRCQHLKNGCVETGGREDLEMKAWRKTRLDRMMVEYLLRQGYYDSALQLAENSKVTHLSNTEVKSILKEPFNKKFHPGCLCSMPQEKRTRLKIIFKPPKSLLSSVERDISIINWIKTKIDWHTSYCKCLCDAPGVLHGQRGGG